MYAPTRNAQRFSRGNKRNNCEKAQRTKFSFCVLCGSSWQCLKHPIMQYALLQTSLEIPPVEKLKRAFRNSGILTEYDAHTVAADAYGILVKDLSQFAANKLHEWLKNEDIETIVVPQNTLPEIPPTQFTKKIQCTAEALIVSDAIGRPVRWEWSSVFILVAGNVQQVKFNRVGKEREVIDWVDESGVHAHTETEYSTKEELKYQLLLEIILNGGERRYSVEVEKGFLYQYLGSRFDPDLTRSFALVVQDLGKFAPHAVVNRGIYYLRENAAPLKYPTRNAFFEEIIWLLWREKNAG